MKIYLIRAAKYFVYVVLLFTVIYFAMYLTGYSTISPEMLPQFFCVKEAIIMQLAILLMILIHPFIGYTNREFNLDFKDNRATIINIFAIYGYSVSHEDEGCIKFRADNKFSRLTAMFEDTITIDFSSLPTKISGRRKMVTRVCYRLNA